MACAIKIQFISFWTTHSAFLSTTVCFLYCYSMLPLTDPYCCTYHFILKDFEPFFTTSIHSTIICSDLRCIVFILKDFVPFFTPFCIFRATSYSFWTTLHLCAPLRVHSKPLRNTMPNSKPIHWLNRVSIRVLPTSHDCTTWNHIIFAAHVFATSRQPVRGNLRVDLFMKWNKLPTRIKSKN